MYTSDFDSPSFYSYWYVIKDDKEDLSLRSYPSKIRSEIRRGLRNCSVDLLNVTQIKSLAEDLYQVYKNAFRRYRNPYIKPVSFEIFKENMLNLYTNLMYGKFL